MTEDYLLMREAPDNGRKALQILNEPYYQKENGKYI